MILRDKYFFSNIAINYEDFDQQQKYYSVLFMQQFVIHSIIIYSCNNKFMHGIINLESNVEMTLFYIRIILTGLFFWLVSIIITLLRKPNRKKVQIDPSKYSIFEWYTVFRYGKQKLVPCSKQTMRMAETDHVLCFSQSHGMLTAKYKFWFTMSKHLIVDGFAQDSIFCSRWQKQKILPIRLKPKRILREPAWGPTLNHSLSFCRNAL